MSTDIVDPVEQSAASLVSGILENLQHLVEQQFQLTRRDVEVELRQHASAAVVFSFGIGVCFLGMIVLCLTLVHLLHWVALPPGTDPAGLPLWACHAVVAAGLIIIGGVLGIVGRVRGNSIVPSQNPITQISQEPVLWTTPRK